MNHLTEENKAALLPDVAKELISAIESNVNYSSKYIPSIDAWQNCSDIIEASDEGNEIFVPLKVRVKGGPSLVAKLTLTIEES